MKPYRNLFFDLDNTVWDFNLNSRYALEETFRRFELELGLFDRFFEIYTVINERLWELYRQKGITKEELSRSRFEMSFKETGIKGVNPAIFNGDYLERLPLQTRLCDGAWGVLEKLSAKYKLHIITNGFKEVQYKKMVNSGLDRFFKKTFISEEIKSPKPSPEIFRHALKSCSARKRESLMIGDDWEVDILGAMQVGIDQVHYAPGLGNNAFTEAEQAMIGRSSTWTYRINRLEEILGILSLKS